MGEETQDEESMARRGLLKNMRLIYRFGLSVLTVGNQPY